MRRRWRVSVNSWQPGSKTSSKTKECGASSRSRSPPHTLLFCSKVPYSYVGCIGESSSWHDAVSDKAHNHEAANWYISSWASDCTFTGVRSDNPYEDSDKPEDKFPLDKALAAQWGFYLEGGAKRLSIIGANAFDACQMSDKTRTGAQKKIMGDKWVLKINSELYELLRIEINNFKFEGKLVAPRIPKAENESTEN